MVTLLNTPDLLILSVRVQQATTMYHTSLVTILLENMGCKVKSIFNAMGTYILLSMIRNNLRSTISLMIFNILSPSINRGYILF